MVYVPCANRWSMARSRSGPKSGPRSVKYCLPFESVMYTRMGIVSLPVALLSYCESWTSASVSRVNVISYVNVSFDRVHAPSARNRRHRLSVNSRQQYTDA
eukprot:Amastigsp_a7112_21.p4 type:complete len:101 gc:universal Amastigsp_a7112_21:1011-709(-)